jgi:hypothetical protein
VLNVSFVARDPFAEVGWPNEEDGSKVLAPELFDQGGNFSLYLREAVALYLQVVG